MVGYRSYLPMILISESSHTTCTLILTSTCLMDADRAVICPDGCDGDDQHKGSSLHEVGQKSGPINVPVVAFGTHQIASFCAGSGLERMRNRDQKIPATVRPPVSPTQAANRSRQAETLLDRAR